MNGPSVLDMWWRDILTVHWRADAAVLTSLLPPGVVLDRFDGDAWLSVVPFRMTNVSVRFSPVLPGFTNVPELNLRTYVLAGKKAGIFFFSLDADAPIAVRVARLATGLPYLHARITCHKSPDGIDFSSIRTNRGVRAGRFHARYRPAGDLFEAAAGTLAHFLHERYLFFVQRGRRLFAGEVRHSPWELAPAQIEIAENTLGDLASHALSAAPACAFFTRALPCVPRRCFPCVGRSRSCSDAPNFRSNPSPHEYITFDSNARTGRSTALKRPDAAIQRSRRAVRQRHRRSGRTFAYLLADRQPTVSRRTRPKADAALLRAAVRAAS